MSYNQLSRREFWLVSTALGVLFATLLLAAALALAVLGVRLGLVPGPALNITFGNFQVVAQTNSYPDCNPRVATCAAQRQQPGSALPRYYSLWVVTTQKVGGPGSSQEQYGGARVFAMQAGP